MMKCYELQGPDGVEGLKLVDKPVPQPGEGQVLVRIKAATLNYRDLLIVKGGYGSRQKFVIEIRWQSSVTAIDARENGALLTVNTPEGHYTMEADWVVAADGGRSFLREALGLQLKGTSYEGRYVIVDILLDSNRPTERLAYFDPACNPGSTVLVHKQPGNVWRIDP